VNIKKRKGKKIKFSILPITFILLTVFNGCKSVEPGSAKLAEKPDPINFEWIRNADVIEIQSAKIYFHGKAKGEYLGNKKWEGSIKGDVFCKPICSKHLKNGLYMQNVEINVSKDSSLTLLDSKFTFDKNCVIWTTGKVKIKAVGGAIRIYNGINK